MSESSSSKLARAIELRPRVVREFEVAGFFGLGEQPIHKIAFRVATKAEEELAICDATRHVDKLTKPGAEAAKDDHDLTDDAKNVQILFEVCRRSEDADADAGYRYPAFPGPQWMREHLTTDQIAILLHLYGEVRKEQGALFGDIDLEQVRNLARLCAITAKTEMPETLLARASREWITQAFVLLSLHCKDLEDENARHSQDERGGGDEARGEGGDGVREPADGDADGAAGSGGDGAPDTPVP